MTPFSLAIFCALLGVRSFLDAFEWRRLLSWDRGQAQALKRVDHALTDFIEALESGWVPAPEAWRDLALLPAPWGALISDATERLRRSGASIVPTLRRVRESVRSLESSAETARNRSAQARAQALACGLMVPVLGLVLDRLMPGVAEQQGLWLGVCGAAALLSIAAGLSLLRLVDDASWGGLPRAARPWVVQSLVAMERLMAAVRSGTPADLAWAETLEELGRSEPGLARALDSVSPLYREKTGRGGGPVLFVELGTSVRQAIQIGFSEGRPCLERLESALSSFRSRHALQVDRELDLLATRALKPLFLGVAPAILGLLAAAVGLAWSDAMSGMGAGGAG